MVNWNRSSARQSVVKQLAVYGGRFRNRPQAVLRRKNFLFTYREIATPHGAWPTTIVVKTLSVVVSMTATVFDRPTVT
jgi:hypothetical protein